MALEAETVGAGSEPLPMSGARVWARGLAAVGRPRRPARVLAVGAAITGGIGIAGTIAASAGAPASAALLGLYAVAMAASVVAAVAAALLAEFAPVTRLFAEHSDALLIVAGDGVVLKANPAFRRLFGAGKFALDRVEAACGSAEAAAAFCGLREGAAQGIGGSMRIALQVPGSHPPPADFDIAVEPGAGPAGLCLWRIRPSDRSAGDMIARERETANGPVIDSRSQPARAVAEPEAAQRAESERAEPAQRFFDDAPVGIAVVDRNGRFSRANPALGALFGAAPEALTGGDLIGFLDPKDHAVVAARLGEAAAGRVDRTPLEIRLAAPAERTLVLMLSEPETDMAGEGSQAAAAAPADLLADRDKAATSAAGDGLGLYFIDVTERKHLEAQIAQSQKMQAIGQLAGGVAHDFNNLLTAMIGFCDLLLLRTRPGDPAFADIMQVKQNANRAANLVRQLLAFSRQQSLQPRVLDITDVLAELANLLRRLIGENIALEFVHGQDLGFVKVDQGQLEQVVINLAVNARDAMPNGGRLTIRTEHIELPSALRRGAEIIPAGDYVLIEVADSGIGIPADTLTRIFEPFFSTKAVGSGTGLGLATVYGIVKQTGGFVFVDSTPGAGTTFSIYLPRHHPEAAPRAAAEPEPALLRDLTGSGTIMLVEDDDAVRMFGARALRNKGYTVIEAKSGAAALDTIRSVTTPIDLVISDVVMPEMDGPSLIREIREFDPRIKVIFISGYAEDGFRRRLGEEGDIHFLAKPFNLKQLALKVKEVIRGDR